MKRILALVPLAALSLSAEAFASPRLGLAVTRADGTACVTFAGEGLRPGTHLYFVLFAPPRVVDGELGAKQTASCAQVPQEGQAYAARLRYSIGEVDENAIAVF